MTVADCQNLTIHIIESHENFAEETVIEPHHLSQQPPTAIYLAHLDELHYISTTALACSSHAVENQHHTLLSSTEQDVLFEQPQNSSPKRKRDAYMRKYRKRARASESLKCQLTTSEKNQNIKYQSDLHKGMNTSEAKEKKIENLISKFHDIVSHGPLYICSCCDQLWYKHSVSSADKVTQSNPTAERYLHQRKSVNNQDKTCRNYLVKNKVPPVALQGGQSALRQHLLIRALRIFDFNFLPPTSYLSWLRLEFSNWFWTGVLMPKCCYIILDLLYLQYVRQWLVEGSSRSYGKRWCKLKLHKQNLHVEDAERVILRRKGFQLS